jgi:hypothetical protein
VEKESQMIRKKGGQELNATGHCSIEQISFEIAVLGKQSAKGIGHGVDNTTDISFLNRKVQIKQVKQH